MKSSRGCSFLGLGLEIWES